MKSSHVYFLGICALLFVIIFVAGCTGTERPISEITSAQTSTMNTCPIPTLVFNNSQKMTKLGNDVGITGLRITGPYDNSSSRPGTVPLGGVIYHDTGFTRIFDSTGKQILFVNDAESITFTPGGGPSSVTSVYMLPKNSQPTNPVDNITYVYTDGVSTCIVIIIKAPSSRIKIIP